MANIRDLVVHAIEIQRQGDNAKAAVIYKGLLDDSAACSWLTINGILEMVCSNYVNALFQVGAGMEAVNAYRQAISLGAGGDSVFDSAYIDGLRQTQTNPVPFRRRMRFRKLIELFRRTAYLEGSVAECGCWRGLSSYLICRELKAERPLFDGAGYAIFDSFEGLSEPTVEDQPDILVDDVSRIRAMASRGNFSATLESLKSALGEFPGIEYRPGWIPDTFASVPERTYRFVHIDVDLYAPTFSSLTYFYPRLSPGACIVSDDYNWPGARKAMREFCASLRIEYQLTEFSQAYIFKSRN